MSERVTYSVEDGIAEIRLNRPDKHNGLDLAMFEGIVAAGERAKTEPGLRAVVLSGEGPSFCAGLDFKSFMAAGQAYQDKLLARGDRVDNIAQRVGWIWTEVPVPVIAALHGTCVGGGLQIALGADIRLAHPQTRLAVKEIVWGLIPDMSITRTLSRLVRLDVAKELTFTGRELDAPEAARLGLVTRVCDDPLAEARALAKTIAERSPHAIRAAKTLWEQAPGLDDRGALALETELQLPLLGSKNQLEAVMARMQKRAPKFEDPS
ncbi:crotonase/enoyl-CoA hydratase family protein [Pseudenhygromyxa sp. WMMC2535]|uniref:crotonase/enoyl-CoA hydratase family protein n=1 Tax=Pseudenhygromyxa sp. WMMC2535 TaxID=2712867 RepID=UPI001555E2F7|nr:crotonase/enoyl-CoA hydratase family protein [Pseudenhygromyxa sp. WMMC2535]NVB37714.1 crotonase/enoyl-CoA hydratase family protein [Pseudenhygromyxa sp. WMMC2535]